MSQLSLEHAPRLHYLFATITEQRGDLAVRIELCDFDNRVVATAEEIVTSIATASALVKAVAERLAIERDNVRIEWIELARPFTSNGVGRSFL